MMGIVCNFKAGTVDFEFHKMSGPWSPLVVIAHKELVRIMEYGPVVITIKVTIPLLQSG